MSKTKRILSLLLVGVLAASFMVGCNKKNDDKTPDPNEQVEETQKPEETEENSRGCESEFQSGGRFGGRNEA